MLVKSIGSACGKELMVGLEIQVKAIAQENEAALVGIASRERLDGAPPLLILITYCPPPSLLSLSFYRWIEKPFVTF